MCPVRSHTQGSVDGGMDVVGLSFGLAQQAFDEKKKRPGTSLVVQWLGLHASTPGGMSLTSDQGARILYAPQCGQKNQATPQNPPSPNVALPVIFHPSLSQEEHVDSQETAELQ